MLSLGQKFSVLFALTFEIFWRKCYTHTLVMSNCGKNLSFRLGHLTKFEAQIEPMHIDYVVGL